MTESEAEESGDEGADGPDEEPAVGHQCHADNAQMTRKHFHFSFRGAFFFL